MNAAPQQDFYSPIPFGAAAPMPANQDASIMEMRWESSTFIARLWQLLAGRVPKEKDGHIVLDYERDPEQFPPLMNDSGATRVIQIITTGFVNSVVSLSNISDDDARLLFEYSFNDLMESIVLNQDEYGIRTTADLKIVRGSLRPLLFSQIMRAVGGWEGKNSKTTTTEVKQDSTQTSRSTGGFSFNPFSRGK